MTYQEILANARTCMGPYCKSCPVCNGVACKNTVPGPGAKGLGTGFIRNYQKWQELCVNMDTICENSQVDTSFTLFGGAGHRVAADLAVAVIARLAVRADAGPCVFQHLLISHVGSPFGNEFACQYRVDLTRYRLYFIPSCRKSKTQRSYL